MASALQANLYSPAVGLHDGMPLLVIQRHDLLINLQLEIPGFFSRFRRVAEVVTQDASSLEALRRSWTFYKERGYQLEKHDL